MKVAYGLSWRAAAWRSAVVGVGTILGVFIVSGALDAVGRPLGATRVEGRVIHSPMQPNADLPTFQPVPRD